MVSVPHDKRHEWAVPGCAYCGGSGFVTHLDRECRCVGRSIHSAAVPDTLPKRIMSDAVQDRLRSRLEVAIIRARGRFHDSSARSLAGRAAYDQPPPSVAKLAGFLGIDEEAAAPIMDTISEAIQTAKKPKPQREHYRW